MLNQKGVNRDIYFATETKKKHLKMQFWTIQKHHTKDNWNPQRVIFFSFLLLKGAFGFGGIRFILYGLIILTLRFFRTHLVFIQLKI